MQALAGDEIVVRSHRIGEVTETVRCWMFENSDGVLRIRSDGETAGMRIREPTRPTVRVRAYSKRVAVRESPGKGEFDDEQ